MKIYRARHLSGPQGLVSEESALPEPGPGEVLIEVHAAGLHLADMAALSGERIPRPALPFTPGREVAGRILALGSGVDGLARDGRVAAFVPWGGLAEAVLASAALCVSLPEAVAAEQAAALPMAYAGALLALEGKAGLAAGETLLVLGAGGQAGLAAIAVGKALGGRVIGVATGKERLGNAASQGADHVIDGGIQSLPDAVGALTQGEGADVVFDPVGGDAFGAALAASAPGARILIAGFASGRSAKIDSIQLFSRGTTVLSANAILAVERDPAQAGVALARVVAWTADGTITPRIAAQFPFSEVRHAFDYVAGRRGSGAVLVNIGEAASFGAGSAADG